MSDNYYEPKDLADFPNITEYAPEQGKKFFEYYTQATVWCTDRTGKGIDRPYRGNRTPLSLLH